MPPRRPRGANRRGCVPLPRESARRARRHAPCRILSGLGKLRREPVPGALAVVALVDRHDTSLRVDDDHRRLPEHAEALGLAAIRVDDLRPFPAVLLDEVPPAVGLIRRIQTEVAVLRMPLDPARVGDRLAIAGASPRRPDVDEHRLAAELRERELLAVERDSCEGRSRTALRIGRGRRAGDESQCKHGDGQEAHPV